MTDKQKSLHDINLTKSFLPAIKNTADKIVKVFEKEDQFQVQRIIEIFKGTLGSEADILFWEGVEREIININLNR